MIIETHAHLYDEQYDTDREAMIQRATDAGVGQFWLPNCDSETIPGMMELAKKYPGKCRPMIGLHPTYVKENVEQELTVMKQWLEKDASAFVAIGEIGLDFYWDVTFAEPQKAAFLTQLQWAQEYQLPIAIHCRNAFWETVELIEKHNDPNLRGIFHCFSGGVEEARKAIELNFLLGIGGVVTFKNGGLDKVIPEVDLKHIVLETDAPYLAPVPYRGKRNESAYLPLIAQKIADLKEVSLETVHEITSANALRLIQ